MKYLIVIALIYILFKYNTLKSLLGSVKRNENSKINKNKPNKEEDGEYIDYEEID